MPVVPKRYLVWAVVSLLVGVALSFASAYLGVWYSAPKFQAPLGMKSGEDNHQFYGIGPVDHRWLLDHEQYPFGTSLGTLYAWVGHDSTQEFFWKNRQGPESIPHWSRARQMPIQSEYDRGIGMIAEVAAGFPLTSWKGELRKQGFRDPGGRWFCFEIEPARGMQNPVIVPVMPIIPEGVLNALFWGGIFFVLTVEPKRIYRFVIGIVRQQKGRCGICGYTVEGLDICPECGTAVER